MRHLPFAAGSAALVTALVVAVPVGFAAIMALFMSDRCGFDPDVCTGPHVGWVVFFGAIAVVLAAMPVVVPLVMLGRLRRRWLAPLLLLVPALLLLGSSSVVQMFA